MDPNFTVMALQGLRPALDASRLIGIPNVFQEFSSEWLSKSHIE